MISRELLWLAMCVLSFVSHVMAMLPALGTPCRYFYNLLLFFGYRD